MLIETKMNDLNTNLIIDRLRDLMQEMLVTNNQTTTKPQQPSLGATVATKIMIMIFRDQCTGDEAFQILCKQIKDAPLSGASLHNRDFELRQCIAKITLYRDLQSRVYNHRRYDKVISEQEQILRALIEEIVDP